VREAAIPADRVSRTGGLYWSDRRADRHLVHPGSQRRFACGGLLDRVPGNVRIEIDPGQSALGAKLTPDLLLGSALILGNAAFAAIAEKTRQ